MNLLMPQTLQQYSHDKGNEGVTKEFVKEVYHRTALADNGKETGLWLWPHLTSRNDQ